jgi:hypothetical protein
MNTNNKEKRLYATPLIEHVLLDNEISLILESDPPFGPDEPISFVPEYFNNDPFKSNIG